MKPLDFTEPLIMGVVNVTPDSFSDGGQFLAHDKAIEHGLALWDQGADILDIGGESTRPNADAVSPAEEQDRILPVIEALQAEGAFLSVDTYHAATMREVIARNVDMINDISALTAEAESLEAARGFQGYIGLMHMQGMPKTMQENPSYNNVVDEVLDFLLSRVEACQSVGIKRNQCIIDPGFGFGKSLEHNLALFRGISKLVDTGIPILIGASRKSFIAHICQEFAPDIPTSERLPGSLAAVLHCWQKGAHIFRVHDVAETRQALEVFRQFYPWHVTGKTAPQI